MLKIKFQDLNGASWNFDQYDDLEEFMQHGDVYISDFGMVPYGAKVTIEEIDEDYEPTVMVTENGSTQEMPERGSIEFEATGFLAGFDRHSEATLDEYNARIGKTIQFVNDHKVEKKTETPETPDTGDRIGKTVAVLMVAVSACAFVMWRIKRRA